MDARLTEIEERLEKLERKSRTTMPDDVESRVGELESKERRRARDELYTKK